MRPQPALKIPTAPLQGLDPAVVQAARLARIPEAHLQKKKTPAKTKPVKTLAEDLQGSDADLAEEDEPVMQAEGGGQIEASQHCGDPCRRSQEARHTRGAALRRWWVGSRDREPPQCRGFEGHCGTDPRSCRKPCFALWPTTVGTPGRSPAHPLCQLLLGGDARIQAYPTTVRFAGILAGLVDSLQAKRYDESLARALVASAATEQLSLDRGSWLLAEPMLLEPPAPQASFVGRTLPTGTEQPFTRLFGSR